MELTLRDRLFADLRARHPRSLKGAEEARAVDPARFDALAETYLSWAVQARGEACLPTLVDAFALFSTEVNLAQARYEASGQYENKSFADCYQDVYGALDTMSDYLWGVYLTNFLWAHHFEIARFFEDRFLSRLPEDARLTEIAPGHGGWGLLALHRKPLATLKGFDISPASIQIASALATAAGLSERVTYEERNALDLKAVPEGEADACICSFLVEHLETPEQLFAVIHHLLGARKLAFITGALTAAQKDHIYEFRFESELLRLCEAHGLRVLETFSGSPQRTLPRAQFLPRSMALIVQKRHTATW